MVSQVRSDSIGVRWFNRVGEKRAAGSFGTFCADLQQNERLVWQHQHRPRSRWSVDQGETCQNDGWEIFKLFLKIASILDVCSPFGPGQ